MSIIVQNSRGGIHLHKFTNSVADIPKIHSLVERSGKRLSCGNTISWIQSSGVLKIPFRNIDFIVPLNAIVRYDAGTGDLDLITKETVLHIYKINI